MIGARPSTLTAPLVPTPLAPSNALPPATTLAMALASALLVTLPVFLQAPWVRLSPSSAAAFTAVLLGVGLALERSSTPGHRKGGLLLVGFAGSWLAGSLFWGWARLHPLCHLPIEAFALPLALGGLTTSRWRLSCGFYLGSLLGTAATDAAIAATGLMPLWPQALAASPQEAALLLQTAAERVLQLPALALVGCSAVLLLQASRWLWDRGEAGQVASAALATTLLVDGLFLLAALLAPGLSGLI